MDELSWRARLAKRNINILHIDSTSKNNTLWFYEFMYHPRPGQVKWCKTYYEARGGDSPEYTAARLEAEVLALRKELEG